MDGKDAFVPELVQNGQVSGVKLAEQEQVRPPVSSSGGLTCFRAQCLIRAQQYFPFCFDYDTVI
jgi:hypothetical protein